MTAIAGLVALVLLPAACGGGKRSTTVGQVRNAEEAKRVVLEVVLKAEIEAANGNPSFNVYLYPTPLEPGSVVSPVLLEEPPVGDPLPLVTTITTRSWLAWVDYAPGGYFAHPTKYLLITETGDVTTIDADIWPVIDGVDFHPDETERLILRVGNQSLVSQPLRSSDAQYGVLRLGLNGPGKVRGLIVSGTTADREVDLGKKAIAEAKKWLEMLGLSVGEPLETIPHAEIGIKTKTTPAEILDKIAGTSREADIAVMIPGLHDATVPAGNRTIGPTAGEMIVQAIEKQCAGLGAGDKFFFYYVGHGRGNLNQSSRLLPNSGKGYLEFRKLAETLHDKCKAEFINVIIEACNSGLSDAAFSTEFKGVTDRRIKLWTSTHGRQPSRYSRSQRMSYFSFAIFALLQQATSQVANSQPGGLGALTIDDLEKIFQLGGNVLPNETVHDGVSENLVEQEARKLYLANDDDAPTTRKWANETGHPRLRAFPLLCRDDSVCTPSETGLFCGPCARIGCNTAVGHCDCLTDPAKHLLACETTAVPKNGCCIEGQCIEDCASHVDASDAETEVDEPDGELDVADLADDLAPGDLDLAPGDDLDAGLEELPGDDLVGENDTNGDPGDSEPSDGTDLSGVEDGDALPDGGGTTVSEIEKNDDEGSATPFVWGQSGTGAIAGDAVGGDVDFWYVSGIPGTLAPVTVCVTLANGDPNAIALSISSFDYTVYDTVVDTEKKQLCLYLDFVSLTDPKALVVEIKTKEVVDSSYTLEVIAAP